jgi:Zn-dependent metalloprotease
MRRVGPDRREGGQISADMMGLLLLAALVIAAVVALGIPEKVAGSINQAICTIKSGTDCGTPGRGGAYADQPYPDSGRADREIYDDDCQGDVPDDAAREGDDEAVGEDQVDVAYENLGRVYDYYYDTFGWDSYDGRGAPVVGVVNYCRGGVDNGVSSWNGERVQFAPGAGDALDTAAHEFTHGVTENTAGLEYQCQSGALNESISDIMAWNLDPADPTYGEDRDAGAIRDYGLPTRFDQPMHVDDYRATRNDDRGDWGGVHTNSGIPNHAYYQLVRRVGRDKAEQIVWRALTEHLEPDSGFEDFRVAMLESAAELYGPDGAEEQGVDDAFAAVGLDGSWEAPEQEGC